jgi:hypothetical protein
VLAVVTSAFLQSSNPDFAIRKIAMEWVLPIILGLSLRFLWSQELDALIWSALIRSTFLLLLISVVTYLLSFGIPHSFHELVYVNRTFLIWKGMVGGISFGEIPVGGVNVLAGYVGSFACLIFGPLVLSVRRRTAISLLGWFGLACLVEYLCFSRGALLTLFLINALFLVLIAGFRSSTYCRAATGLTACLFAASVLPAGSWEYWKGQFTLNTGTTAASRLSQWLHLQEARPRSAKEVPVEARQKMSKVVTDEAKARSLLESSTAPSVKIESEGPSAAKPSAVASLKARPVGRALPEQSTRGYRVAVGIREDAAKAGSQTLVSEITRRQAASSPLAIPPNRPLLSKGPLLANTGFPKPAVSQVLPQIPIAEQKLAAGRQELAAMIYSKIGSPTRRLILGFGLGHYGILLGMVPDSGTHNIFLNAFIDAGLLGGFTFASFLILGFHRRFRAWWRARRTHATVEPLEASRFAALLSILLIGVLVDFRLENLGTMTGAAFLWYLLAAPIGQFTSEKHS